MVKLRSTAERPLRIRSYRAALIAALCLVGVLGVGCATGDELSADSSCRDFLQASSDDQNAAIAKASDELDTSISYISTPNIYNNCSIDQDQTLGDVVARFGGT